MRQIRNDRLRQDELLLIRNDIFTVYRPVTEGASPLFPLRYARTRPGSERVPTLVVPGGPGTASVLPFDQARKLFAGRGIDTVMMEHRGVGLSRLDARGRQIPPSAITTDAVVADMRAVLDHARIPRACLYGTGYGAYLCLAFALRYPERTDSLVLDSPLVAASDQIWARRVLREKLWSRPGENQLAARVRDLIADGTLDPLEAGHGLRAVHEIGGPAALEKLITLLGEAGSGLTWTLIVAAMKQHFFSHAPYVQENDLLHELAVNEFGRGSYADGLPLDTASPLMPVPASAAKPPVSPNGHWEKLSQISVPTTVLSGAWDITCPPELAAEVSRRIPHAQLIRVPETGFSILDSRAGAAAIATQWTIRGAAAELTVRENELLALPRTASGQVLNGSVQLGLAAESLSPLRWRIQRAKVRRAQDPGARRRNRRAHAQGRR
ncbi:alpha/beta hydrolase [Dermabacteraceae bacterium TAE3-ERU27]|nr:alpha/beta hydrolase [Dermabacteraceae bacterium TAE3-ERU27]